MNKLKRLIFVLAMITILVCAMSVSVMAATTVSTGNATVYAGDTVTIPVKVSSNAGFVSGSIYIEYDDTVLELTGVNDKALIGGASHTTRFTSPYILSWENDTKTSNYTANGTLAELVFTVSAYAEPGNYKIEISVPTHGILNSDGNVVDCSFSAGSVTVLEEECSHDWSEWKKSSSTRHKRSCDLCGEVEYDSHEWDDGEVTEEATEDTTGVLTYTCDVCGATKTEIIPELPSEDVFVNGVTLNKSTAILTVGDTLTLNATVTPYDATNKAVRWTSSNTSVAKVSNGTVTALASGTTVITVTTNDGGYTAKCTVTVNDKVIEPSTDAQITVGNVSARAGGTISVPVVVSNNPGIVSMTLKVSFDTSVLTLTGITDTGLLPGSMHTTKYTSPYTLTWENDTASANIKVNGTLVYLLFTVSANATEGTSIISITTPMDGIYNYDGDNVNFEMSSGSVDVRNYIIGDVNGDGSVTNKDRLVLSRYLAEWDGYDISMIDQNASDVNSDGVITNKDRLVLSRHLAEWEGYETLPVK